MPVIGVTASTEVEAQSYMEALAPWESEVFLLLPGQVPPLHETMSRVHGLLVSGGEDIHPNNYGDSPNPEAGLTFNLERDHMELAVLQEALTRNMPVLGICRGLQALNVVMGGRLIQDLHGHKEVREASGEAPAYHHIWISPGSKLAAVLGAGGKVRVNSKHHQGLREPQKSPKLLASAYSLEDGVIEGLESPNHSWVVAVQCQPELRKQVPRQFQHLFQSLVHRAGIWSAEHRGH